MRARAKEVSRPLLVFAIATILMQIYYGVSYMYNLWSNYFPWGYVVHLLFYASVFTVTMIVAGDLRLSSLGFTLEGSAGRYAAIGFIFAVVHHVLRVILIQGTFGKVYPIPVQLFAPAYLTLGILIGISEEVAFRGYILKSFLKSLEDIKMKDSYKIVLAVLISSFLFGVYHIYFVGSAALSWWILYVLQAMTAGIFMSSLFLISKLNLLGAIAYHSAVIVIGNIMPWTPASDPSHQLIVAIFLNLIQTVILNVLASRWKSRARGVVSW